MIFQKVTLRFFTFQDELVPVTQDVITPSPELSKNSYWELVVQPAKFGRRRAATGGPELPFPLG